MANQPINTGINNDLDVSSGKGQLDFNTFLPGIIDKFVSVLEAAILIIGAIFLIRFLKKRIHKLELIYEHQRNAINLFEKITTGFILVVSVTTALKLVGIDMTLLVSVAILGLSYGLQDIIKNYVAGILILFKAPFKIGDVIKIKDNTGRVSKMDFQATLLETFDGKQITIYNSDVMTQSIVNFSNMALRRVDLDVTVGYGTNMSKALEIFNRILKSHPQVLASPKSSIIFKKFTESGPAFTLKFWLQQPCNLLQVKTDIAKQVSQAFDDKEVFIPYSKAIECDNESLLSELNPAHQARIANFYQMPLFQNLEPATQEALGEETLGTDSIDFDEPE